MSKRFFVLTPDDYTPSGGIDVLYRFASILNSEGYDAYVLHNSPHFRNRFVTTDAPVRYSLALRRVELRKIRDRRRIGLAAQLARAMVSGDKATRVTLNEDDVLLTPELLASSADAAFPAPQKVLVSQGAFLYLDQVTRGDERARRALTDWRCIATSAACTRAARWSGNANVAHVPVTVAPPKPRRPKRPIIAYMPRKNRTDVETVIELLRRRGKVADYEFCTIDGVSRDEVANALAEATFFLAFSEREGFGLPPAEAMAAECVVIGYTAHGGDEFFTEETGVPIRSGDLIGFVEAIEQAVADFRENPERLDRIRKQASQTIRETYNHDSTRQALLATWRDWFGSANNAKRQEMAT